MELEANSTGLRALSPHELAYQESLVQERETEIREIETGIHELNEITRDLATIITEQGSMIGKSPYPNPFLVTATSVHICPSALLHKLSRFSHIDGSVHRQHRIKHLKRRSTRSGRRPRAHHRSRLPAQSGIARSVVDDHHRHRRDSRSNRCAFTSLCLATYVALGVRSLHAETRGRYLFSSKFLESGWLTYYACRFSTSTLCISNN